jgi:hypothetical protein
MRGVLRRILRGGSAAPGIDPLTFVPEAASPAVVATQAKLGRSTRSPVVVWFSKGGWIALAAPALLALACCFLVGAARTGELLLGVTSPVRATDAVAVSLVSWLTAIVGWLGVPVLVGGVVGHSIASTLSSYRSRTMEEIVHSVGPTDE